MIAFFKRRHNKKNGENKTAVEVAFKNETEEAAKEKEETERSSTGSFDLSARKTAGSQEPAETAEGKKQAPAGDLKADSEKDGGAEILTGQASEKIPSGELENPAAVKKDTAKTEEAPDTGTIQDTEKHTLKEDIPDSAATGETKAAVPEEKRKQVAAQSSSAKHTKKKRGKKKKSQETKQLSAAAESGKPQEKSLEEPEGTGPVAGSGSEEGSQEKAGTETAFHAVESEQAIFDEAKREEETLPSSEPINGLAQADSLVGAVLTKAETAEVGFAADESGEQVQAVLEHVESEKPMGAVFESAEPKETAANKEDFSGLVLPPSEPHEPLESVSDHAESEEASGTLSMQTGQATPVEPAIDGTIQGEIFVPGENAQGMDDKGEESAGFIPPKAAPSSRTKGRGRKGSRTSDTKKGGTSSGAGREKIIQEPVKKPADTKEPAAKHLPVKAQTPTKESEKEIKEKKSRNSVARKQKDLSIDMAEDAAKTSANEEEPVLEPLVRVDPDVYQGLTGRQVEERISHGAVNHAVKPDSPTLKDIVKENVFTYFNLIFFIMSILVLAVGSYRDLTFLPVVVSNACIGIFQEWRSKKALDKLTLLAAPKAQVIRDGQEQTIPAEELVLDDLVVFQAGNQIPADAVVVDGNVQVNESLLTGEADEISKETGDELLSGSYIVSGQCRARLDKVGEDSYISRLTLQAKAQKRGEQSEMIRSLDRLVKIIGILIIPIGILLFSQQYFVIGENLRNSVTGTVAAIVGMIPEGLYLLASVALAVSAMRLAVGKVLVHNMKSIETLARADVLCVDKTGTITENRMTVKKAVPLRSPSQRKAAPSLAGSGVTEEEEIFTPEEQASFELQLGDFVAAMSSDNITMAALQAYFENRTGKRPDQVFGFSPVYKYSGAVFGSKSYVLGAPEFLLRKDYESYRSQIERYSSQGLRVLVFGEYLGNLDGKALTQKVNPSGMVLLTNPVRESAPETFRYFAGQGVAIKVISGDNPVTVSYVAKEAQIENADKYVDATTLKTDQELLNACDKYTVFGRVTPEQKRQLIRALRKKGHTVAMTGDGVNDVLALKDADCSIAMASGSDAAAHAAQMVLLESDFSKMPSVVAEGCRVVNNIERTASLFLVKNIFSLLMSVFSIVFAVNYPLEPSQVALISTFTIGVPAFLMSLEQNKNHIHGHFFSNVFFRALPAGLTNFAVISTLVVFCQEFGVADEELSTSCTILMAIVGLMILYRIASPMTRYHWLIWFSMVFCILFSMTFLNQLYSISALSKRCAMLLVIFAIITEPCMRYLSILIQKIWSLAGWTSRRIRGFIEARKKEAEI